MPQFSHGCQRLRMMVPEGDPVIRIVSKNIFNLQESESVVNEHDPSIDAVRVFVS